LLINLENSGFLRNKEGHKRPVSGFKLVARVIVWSIFILFYFFLFFLLLSGCAYFKKEKAPKEKEFICSKIDCGDENIDELVEKEKNTIACIKLQPECKLDTED